MNKFVRLIVLFGVCLSLSCGCSKPDKPMPLTKENLTQYLRNTQAVTKRTDPKEYETAKGDPNKQKMVFYKFYVKPMETMGYSYDKTISDMAGKFLAKTLLTTDPAFSMELSDLLTFAKDTREAAYQLGFISVDTKGLLDQVSLVLPRTVIPPH